MKEYYTILPDGASVSFQKRDDDAPQFLLSQTFDPKNAPKDLSVVCRMGTPEAMHCIIYRLENRAGGIFAVHDDNGFLFGAIAESELAYALAKGFFGRLAENAANGIDIFENPGIGDD